MSNYVVTATHAVDVPHGGSFAPGEQFEHSGNGLSPLLDAGLVTEIEAPKTKEKVK